MDDDFFSGYWNAQQLKRWPHEHLRGLNIPESAKVFLETIGLPSIDNLIWVWKFVWHDTVVRSKENDNFYCIGICYNEEILIDSISGNLF
jgi:hypothetical protein